ncbi:hypothetical protein DOTSEDRAFT_47933 [Dothistroma septosporum NZE10]|uniref:Uncharacterized protein n=1 Tax=Dothistroma septosporum (strain NZE10 / CBS 128990) TaxID=675120 RepID=M2XIY7_DOTSN|nr:hypothetical protein DOTSEDRAFT_47933 [Dothistroma septosporum NZE10]
MSHPSTDTPSTDLKPRPKTRRPFELGSAPNSAPPTPPSEAQNLTNGLRLDTNSAAKMSSDANGSATPSRNRSFLNLTGSTLFGIYQPAGLETDTANPTPWGTGAQTPAGDSRGSFDFTRVALPEAAFQKGVDGKIRRRSTVPQQRYQASRHGFKGYVLPTIGRVLALFGVGLLYGLLISHLHDQQKIAPVAVNLDRSRWSYLATWGCIGVLLGEALPWIDSLWAEDDKHAVDDADNERTEKHARGMDAWMDVVRLVGAFVGIAFAIRKLPWQSTLQLSLTLALANPAVWYLIDRSPPGFIMSSLVAISGTALLLGISPTLVPSPSPWQVLKGGVATQGIFNDTFDALKSEELVLGIFSQESVSVATWIASVLFVSSVCFGNIGRRLAPRGD